MTIQNLQQAQQRQQEIKAEAQRLIDAADRNADTPGKFTQDQQQRFDELMAEEEQLREQFPQSGRLTTPDRPASPDSGPVRQREGQALPSSGSRRPSGSPAFRHPSTGEPVYALRHDEPISGDHSDGAVGDICSAMVRGDVDSLPGEIRGALTGGGDGGGNYLLTPQMSGRVVDLARSASVVMRLGAQTVPMETNELHLLRVLSDPTVNARRETASATASKPTFGRYTLRSKMYSAIVPVSMEELEDAANAGMLIEQTLRNALGTAVDGAILQGEGSGEILGITNTDGVNTITGVGTPSNYANVSAAVGDIYAANYSGDPSGLSWVANPQEAETYDGLTASDGQPLRPTPWAGALNRAITTGIDAGDMVVGDFSEVLVGMRTSGVVLDVLDSGSVTDDNGDSYNAATQFMRFIRARIRIDALAMRPDHFTVLSGVTA